LTDLFDTEEGVEAQPDRPLPDRLRPRNIDEIVGQEQPVVWYALGDR
jgi:replication-associated recombination protein RarA